MRGLRVAVAVMALASLGGGLQAQKEKRQPLTEGQIEKIREAGIYPDDRIKLYTQFVGEHAQTIKELTNRRAGNARSKRVDEELLDLTALMDELGGNLDQYAERKADLRPSLKKLNEEAPKWLSILKALPGEPAFDVARKEAIESGDDLAEQAKRLLTEQTTYFDAHKEEKGQERAEPK